MRLQHVVYIQLYTLEAGGLQFPVKKRVGLCLCLVDVIHFLFYFNRNDKDLGAWHGPIWIKYMNEHDTLSSFSYLFIQVRLCRVFLNNVKGKTVWLKSLGPSFFLGFLKKTLSHQRKPGLLYDFCRFQSCLFKFHLDETR